MKKKKVFSKILSLLVLLLGLIGLTSVNFKAAPEAKSFRPTEAISAEDSLQKANELNKKLTAEGSVLLKNENNTLPLAVGSKVSVLGKSSVNPVLGGGGSSAGESGGAAAVDVFKSLNDAGFIHNPVLRAFYQNNALSGAGRPASTGTGQAVGRTGETPIASYTEDITSSFAEYNDFAIVYITRLGGEGWDLYTNVDGQQGRETPGQHYLQLDTNEEALIEMATTNFEKVVVVLNISTTFQIGDLENNDKIDAILWIGLTGATGLDSLGKILNGQINPSGRTFALYSKDFKADPTWPNFANNAAAGNQYKTEAGANAGRRFVSYEEGIYLGYRYYETRGFVEGGTWYDDNVVYPFGYGLSYTTFEWEVMFPEVTLAEDTVLEINVKVRNTGDRAGKEVVQIYSSAPYYEGEIEKAHVVLVGFGKTKLLQPGESETITIEVPVYLMASYDYNDANFNDFKGYEVEKGEYTLYVGQNSHHSWKNGTSKVYKVVDDILIENDPVSGNKVENRFDDVSAAFDPEDPEVPFSGQNTLMSRMDFAGTFPQEVTPEELIISGAELDLMVIYPDHTKVPNPTEYDSPDKPWYVAEMPEYADVRKTDIKLTELVGKDYDDPLWEQFMSQLTLDDYAEFVRNGFFGSYPIPELEIPVLIMPDGPTGFVKNPSAPAGYGAPRGFYASPIVVASTFNVDLALEQGEVLGEEGLWMGFAGIYAPATNMHRSPFSGRNFEYYSEDPLLAGKISGATTKGLQNKGISVFLKHFAINDQETNRNGTTTWATEQVMREIYLKSFEIAVKEGNATGIMSAFNRIGVTWAGASYPLLTNVLREEWGFQGSVVTDWGNRGYMNLSQMVRAGNDFYLANHSKPSIAAEDLTPSYVYALKKSAKNVLYTVANSAAMNNLGPRYNDEKTTAAKNLGTFNKGDSVSFNAASINYAGVTYELDNAPRGLQINKYTGVISGQIAEDAVAGSYKMTVVLEDRTGYLSQGMELSIIVNGGLSFIGEDTHTLVSGQVSNLDVRFAGNGVIAYTISGGTLPQGLVLNNGYIAGSIGAAGTHTVTVKASIGEDVLEKQITINVVNPELFYELAVLNYSANEEQSFSVNVADEVIGAKYSATGLPQGLSISEAGVISGTPTEHGTFTVEITAKRAGYANATKQITISVVEAALVDSTKPTITITTPATAIAEDEVEIKYTVNDDVTDAANLVVTVTVKKGSEDVTLTNNKFVAAEGTYEVTVTATDEAGNTETKTLTIVVSPKTPDTPEPPVQPKKGCKGSVVASFIGLFAVLGTIVVIKKRKH